MLLHLHSRQNTSLAHPVRIESTRKIHQLISGLSDTTYAFVYMLILFMYCSIINFVINRKGKKKPVEPEIKEDKPYLEEQYANSFIRETSELRELVPLPPSIDLNEWIATNSKFY